MTEFMRLRQICLVAPRLEPTVGDIAAIMGLNICYRDPNVARYGLENALLPVDTILLEVVAPFRDGTAAGRFIEKTGGRGGYMAIFVCDDPRERQTNAESIGVRTSHVIDRPPYLGVQLHPRDCRAAFIEFNHAADSDNIRGISMLALNSVKLFYDTEESKEGMRAFHEKRTPEFHKYVK